MSSDLGVRGRVDVPVGNGGSAYGAQRVHRDLTPRARAWADQGSDLQAVVGKPHVFIVGDDSAGTISRWASAALPVGWAVASFYGDDRAPVLTLAGPAGTTRISCADQWTRRTVTATDAQGAWRWLEAAVARHFRGGVLLDSPASTGRDLLARSLPAGVRYTCQPLDVAAEIRATAGQHRMEQLAPEGADLPGMVELDMRMAYAACVGGVPWGWPVHQEGEPEHWDPWRPARYYATWTVPTCWQHVGILPMQVADKWEWPAEPGEWGCGWLDYRELALARRHGWEVTVAETVTWPGRRSAPLRTWAKHLVEIAQEAQEAAMGDTAREAAQASVRAILLHGIGALHGQARKVTRSCLAGEPGRVPAEAEGVQVVGDRIVWQARVDPAWPGMVHPEWTSAVWASARCSVLESKVPGGQVVGALQLPREQLVGIRGDAIYATCDPGWPDDGQAGRFRVKSALGPFTMPRSLVALDGLRGRGNRAGVRNARKALADG